jgi:uncharacterized protein involved in cysteine biosynthesis
MAQAPNDGWESELCPRSGAAGLVGGAWAVAWGLRQLGIDRELRRLALIPLALTLVVYLALGGLVLAFGDDLVATLWPRPAEGGTLLVWYATVGLAMLVLGAVSLLFFGAVVDTLGAPFFDAMAIRVLARRGVSTREPGLLETMLPDLVRSSLFALAGLVLGALALLPGMGLVALSLGAAVSALGRASSAFNPALLVTDHDLKARLAFLRAYPAAALGLGGATMLLLLVPLVGIVAVPSSIVGASALVAAAPRRRARSA